MSNLQTPSTSHPEESFNDFYHEVNTVLLTNFHLLHRTFWLFDFF